MLRVSIADQGLGISPEDMEKLFGAFQKTDTLPTAEERGSGLGLSICRRIVELHGGRIEAQSEAGKGSIFSFWLPA